MLKWVLRSSDEEDREQAAALKSAWLAGSCEIAVPALWTYEVGNVLRLKEPESAGELLQALIDLEMPETRPRQYVDDILRLMRRHRVTFYDAAYHALAIDSGGTMVTADSAHLRRAASAGHLKALSHWRLPSQRG